jgi:hypothetical protein
MNSNKSNRSRAASARGFIALFVRLVLFMGLLAMPAEAAPFAYVANVGSATVSRVSVGPV